MGNRRHRSAIKRSAPQENSFGAVEGNFKSTLIIDGAAVEMKSNALQLTWTAGRPRATAAAKATAPGHRLVSIVSLLRLLQLATLAVRVRTSALKQQG
jgi:hypothetical protein